jgi:cell division protein ZapA
MGEQGEESTQVNIYKQTYHVRSSGDSSYVRELARHVDQRMNEVAEHTPTVDTLKVAILAALNIADEYFSAKKKLEALDHQVSQKSEKMLALLEPFLSSRSP